MSIIFRRTLVAVIVLFGLTANASALLSAWLLHSHLTEEYLSKGQAMALALAAASPGALAAGDDDALQAMIAGFLSIEGVGYAYVADGAGRMRAHTLGASPPPLDPAAPAGRESAISFGETDIPGVGECLQITVPINGGAGGHVGLGMAKAGIKRVMYAAVLRQELLMLVMCAVAVAVFYVLVGSVTRPLVRLADYAVRIRSHDFSAALPETGDDEVGVLARAMGSMADQLSLLVSDLKRAVSETTHELQDALARIQAIIDNLADGLLVVDADGRITLHNPALLAMFGRTADDVSDKTVREAFPEALANLADLAGATGPNGRTASAEVSLAGGGTGKAVATLLRPSDTQDAAGDHEAIILLVRDITTEKAVDRMKTEFISTVSHELRTPLTSVLGFAKIIRRRFRELVAPALSPTDAKAQRGAGQIRDNLDIIVAEGERLTELVNDVLDIAKMESGRCEWNMAAISLTAVAAHAAGALAPLAARKRLDLALDMPPDLPMVLGDRDRLVQVFLNLVGNAVKFTASGGIRVAATTENGHIRVTVADTGPGIDPRDQERVFEKFRQVGDTLTEKPRGTGLGLSICRQIVERHGGRIWVESQPGEGSTFIFTLPALGRTGEEDKAACPLPRALVVDERPHRGRILVVDDDPAARLYLETILSAAGYSVALARDGGEALALATGWPPDCITMDLRLPGMDGEEVIRLLRSVESTRHIPILVISVDSRQRLTGVGADAAMGKPVDREALLDTVRGLLEGRGPEDERPCLFFSKGGERKFDRRFFLCPGEATALCDENDLWRTLSGGFRGSVFVPASLGHGLNLAKLCAYPGVHVVIIPD